MNANTPAVATRYDPGMKRILTAAAAISAALALASCSTSEGGDEQTSPPPSSPSSASPSTKAVDTAGYLKKVRSDTSGGDDVSDARLIDLGKGLCADLEAGRWDETTIDDESKVGDLPTQMRINIGFAATHFICPNQEAEYLRKAAAAFNPPTAATPETVVETPTITTPEERVAPNLPESWDKDNNGMIDTDAPIG